MTIESAIIDFLEYIEIEKGRTVGTAKNYDHYLRTFADFARENEATKPEDITLDLVKKYRLAMNRVRKPLSKATQNYYLIALRSFLKYLAQRNITTLGFDRIELAKGSQRQIAFLEHEELDDLFSRPDLKTLHGRRDRAILDLFFSTGLRVSELVNLKKDDLNLDKNEFSVRGKGGKIRVVFMDENARASLKYYLDTRTDPSPYLFISYGKGEKNIPEKSLNRPISPRSIQRMIKKYATSAGFTKKVTPHTMRHSFATDLLQSGADLRAVQKLLGHTSVMTTEIYTHVTDQHLQEVHQAFHGLRRHKEKPPLDPNKKSDVSATDGADNNG